MFLVLHIHLVLYIHFGVLIKPRVCVVVVWILIILFFTRWKFIKATHRTYRPHLFFILRRIHRGTALLDKLEEREGSARIIYSRDCGGLVCSCVKIFYDWKIGIFILDDVRIVNVAPITILISWEIFLRGPRKASEMTLVSRDTRQMTCKNVISIVDMRESRSELPSLLHRRGIDILPIMLWGFWDWTDQVWLMSTYNSASVKVINLNLFLKSCQVTDWSSIFFKFQWQCSILNVLFL